MNEIRKPCISGYCVTNVVELNSLLASMVRAHAALMTLGFFHRSGALRVLENLLLMVMRYNSSLCPFVYLPKMHGGNLFVFRGRTFIYILRESSYAKCIPFRLGL